MDNEFLFTQIRRPPQIRARTEDDQFEEIYEKLLALNDSLNFVPDFVSHFGYPLWSGAMNLTGDTDESFTIAIPTLFTDATELSGLIICVKAEGDLRIEFRSVDFLRNYMDSIEVKPFWPNASIYAGFIMHAEVGLFDTTRLGYLYILLSEFDQEFSNNLMPRTEYDYVEICFLVPAGVDIGSGFPDWILALGYQHFPRSQWLPLSDWEDRIGSTITNEQFNQLVDFYNTLGNDSHVSPVAQYQIVCEYFWVPIGDGPYDFIFSGNGAPGSPGNSGGGSSNLPGVNLDSYFRRLESCGGLGDPYDYGPTNPTGQHPDQVFCEQLQRLYDCLPFLASDKDLVAWYLWYDDNYSGDTWQSLLEFGCSTRLSPLIKEEGIRMFRRHFQPGDPYPGFNNDWEVFLDFWENLWTCSLPRSHKTVIADWLDNHWDNFWSEGDEAVNSIEALFLANVQLLPGEIECLLGQSGSATELNDYIQSIISSNPGQATYMAEFGSAAIKLLCADAGVIMSRLIELEALVYDNPDILLEDCINANPGIDLQDYAELFNFEIPQVCKDRLISLGSGWGWQSIDQGNVRKASVDYYPVEIAQRPDFNGDGIADSNDEIFHAIRMEFLDLADGAITGYDPVCPGGSTSTVSWDFKYYDEVDPLYVGQDRDLWPTQSPLTSIFYIEASSDNFVTNLVADHGAVIVSDYCPNQCWVFSTIETPASGSQPLSGNRQWGVNEVNGALTFYNRAVDRAHVTTILKILTANGPCAATDYYRIGTETWKNLQHTVVEFIIQHGGMATIDPNARFAVNPDFENLMTLLKGDDLIQSVPCLNNN